MNRRDFIKVGSLGLSYLGLPTLVDANSPKQAKAVIFIMMQGGASHQEAFIAKPDSPERSRSVTGYINTANGYQLGGSFVELAALSNFYSVVHSYGHTNASHGMASEYTITGYNSSEESDLNQKHPSYGSVVSREFGINNVSGVPYYISINKLHADRASYFGNSYNPFSISEEGKRSLSLGLPKERFETRMNLMAGLDRRFANQRISRDIDGHKKLGREMLLGSVREIFEIEKEPPSVQNLYGNDGFARNCMMARRLVQNGAKFVTLGHGGWDWHTDILNEYNRNAPRFDHGVAALLTDLHRHGMLESTLVVVTSEFGRTNINAGAGRDHWSQLCNLMLAGGNYIGKGVIGEASKDGMTPLSSAYSPVDLLHTICNHMNINHKSQYTDQNGRPRYLVEGDSRVIM